MNTQSSTCSERTSNLTATANGSLLVLVIAFSILIFTSDCFAQTFAWRYIATVPGNIKTYLNDEVKNLPDKNKTRWEKIIKPDGSSATALIEWNCPAKLRLIYQITFYNSDASVIGTKKSGFDWSPIIPGSSADFLYKRVCLTVTPKTAEITAAKVDLRTLPDADAPIARIAKRGDKFQIAPESGRGGWFNVVDPDTQEDYWLKDDSFKLFKTVDSIPPLAKAVIAKTKPFKSKTPAKRTKRKNK